MYLYGIKHKYIIKLGFIFQSNYFIIIIIIRDW